MRVRTRQQQLREGVCRVIWNETEHESEDEELLLDILQSALSNGERDPQFGLTPLHAHVMQLCAAMNLPLEVAERWAELPDLSATRRSEPALQWIAPPDPDEDEDPPEPTSEEVRAWRSSE
jgi:hypothetical protein